MKQKSKKPEGTKTSYTKGTLRKYCDLLATKDKRIQSIIQELGYPPFWHREPGFEALVMIILEQQVSLASAFSTFQKLKDRIGKVSPDAILKMTDEDFQTCGFSRQKKSYVGNLAEAIISKNLNLTKLKKEDSETIRKSLTAIKGIGNWTVDVYLLSCLHKLDIFPIGDLALIKSMTQAEFISPKDTKETILRKTNKFKPYRSIFTIIMWHRYIKQNNIKVQFDL